MAAPRSKYRRQRDTRAAREALRAKDQRIVAGAEAAREVQRRLQARMRYEAAQEALRLAEAAITHHVGVPQAQLLREEAQLRRAQEERDYQGEMEAKRERWPYGEARDLVRQGYPLAAVRDRTGWPLDMLEDVEVGQW